MDLKERRETEKRKKAGKLYGTCLGLNVEDF